MTQSIMTDKQVNAMLASAGIKLPPVVMIGELPSGYTSLDQIAQYQLESDIEYRRNDFVEDYDNTNIEMYNDILNDVDTWEIAKDYIKNTLKGVACKSIQDNLNNAGFKSVLVTDHERIDKYVYTIDMPAFRKELAAWLRANKAKFIAAITDKHSSYPGFYSFRSTSPVESLHKFLEDKYAIEDLFNIVFTLEHVYDDTQWEFYETDGTNFNIPIYEVYVHNSTDDDGNDYQYTTVVLNSIDCVDIHGHSTYRSEWLSDGEIASIDNVLSRSVVESISDVYNKAFFSGIDSDGERAIFTFN